MRPARLLLVLILSTLPLPNLATRAGAQHALANGGGYSASVPVPKSVLGYEVGERFTPHHLLMRYLERVAATSRRVRIDTVGHSFEGREVMMAIVTSEENMGRIEQIRADANRIADPRGVPQGELDAVARRLPAIVWMGYTVHGPEASGVEAAIAFLYQLAAGEDAATRMILDSTVILIDPVQNPDGHERHAQDVMRMRSSLGVPSHPSSRIHSGTWPGPRTSHYYFDLNRDWYAQSHPETRARTAAMLRWWPQVAVDLHEMGSNSTYFFPPAMDPVNKLVHQNIVRWWDVFAEGTIGEFDREGWSFFRREGYDEFYPGYGSSWPLYLGAVGMTYEQASSRGGAIRRSDGTVLTLHQAARQHYTASWATALTAARNARQLVRDYLAYRQSAIADGMRAPLRWVVLERDSQGRADSLARLIASNGIEVQRLRSGGTVQATEYGGTGPRSVRLPDGAYVVDFAQPQGRLARALLEPDAPLDSAFIAEELERRRTGLSERFYDVTAWALPYTSRVRSWGTSVSPGALEAAPATAPGPTPPDRARYGYAFAPGSEAALRMLAGLLADSVRVWFAPRSFRAGGTEFRRGALVVRVASNDTSIHDRVRRLAAESGTPVIALASSAVEAGTDLGSNSVFPLRTPRVAILAGTPVSGQSFGWAWYAFDQRLAYPTTPLEVDAVTGAALADFDVLVIPSTSAGALASALGDGGRDRIAAWVRAGGVVITLDAATAWLASPRSTLSRFRPHGDSARAEGPPGAPLSMSVPGAIVRATVDTLSPLLAGIDAAEMPVLANSDRVYTVPRDLRPGELPIRYAPRARLRLAGYMWPEVPERLADSPYLFTERVGRGRVIGFAGDPNFRDLWRGLLPLFGNAVFLGASY
ncbi:MAG TPA: M14 metallopeptidase family protein [Gemmatimonadaceae bacterium]|nr:M14 metallopeptidase family protein [Gemmatimonadaceae bacterium]